MDDSRKYYVCGDVFIRGNLEKIALPLKLGDSRLNDLAYAIHIDVFWKVVTTTSVQNRTLRWCYLQLLLAINRYFRYYTSDTLWVA